MNKAPYYHRKNNPIKNFDDKYMKNRKSNSLKPYDDTINILLGLK